MGGPDWLSDLFAGVMLLTAAYCVSRLVIAPRLHRRTEADVEVVHIAMGVVMAGMFVVALQFIPNGLAAAFFAAATIWFGYHAVIAFRQSAGGWTGGHHALPHVVLSGAMFYMLVAGPTSMAAMTSMTQTMSTSVKFAPLGAILALLLFGIAIWYTNQLTSRETAAAFELAGLTSQAAPLPASAVPPAPAGSPVDAAEAAATGVDEPILAPRLAICCHIVMCVAMGYMLITML